MFATFCNIDVYEVNPAPHRILQRTANMSFSKRCTSELAAFQDRSKLDNPDEHKMTMRASYLEEHYPAAAEKYMVEARFVLIVLDYKDFNLSHSELRSLPVCREHMLHFAEFLDNVQNFWTTSRI